MSIYTDFNTNSIFTPNVLKSILSVPVGPEPTLIEGVVIFSSTTAGANIDFLLTGDFIKQGNSWTLFSQEQDVGAQVVSQLNESHFLGPGNKDVDADRYYTLTFQGIVADLSPLSGEDNTISIVSSSADTTIYRGSYLRSTILD